MTLENYTPRYIQAPLGENDEFDQLAVDLMINQADESDISCLKEKREELAVKSGAFGNKSLRHIFEMNSAVTGLPVASAILQEEHGLATIEEFHVEEGERQKGHGKKLLSAIEDFARANGIAAIKASFPSWGGPTLFHKADFQELMRLPLTTKINGVRQYDLTMAKVLN